MSQPIASSTQVSPFQGAIGVFDSGVGGLSVLRAIHAALPHEHLVYVADSGHAPYGDQSEAHITQRTLTVGNWLAEQGVPVWIDADHAAAHNKVMVIDNGTPDAAVITGSFNFTHAGQHRNAENLLILRGNAILSEAYAANWRRHKIHALPLHR